MQDLDCLRHSSLHSLSARFRVASNAQALATPFTSLLPVCGYSCCQSPHKPGVGLMPGNPASQVEAAILPGDLETSTLLRDSNCSNRTREGRYGDCSSIEG